MYVCNDVSCTYIALLIKISHIKRDVRDKRFKWDMDHIKHIIMSFLFNWDTIIVLSKAGYIIYT